MDRRVFRTVDRSAGQIQNCAPADRSCHQSLAAEADGNLDLGARAPRFMVGHPCNVAPGLFRVNDIAKGVRLGFIMRISDSDWSVFLGHAAATLAKFKVPEAEQRDVVAFVQSLKKEIVE